MRLACWRSRPAIADFSENCFGEMPKVRAGLALGALLGNETKKNSERFFCTSNPPVSRGELAAEPFAPLSFFFLRRSFFAVRADWRIPESVYSERGPKTLKSGFSVTLANEADRFEYSGSWLAARRSFGLTFFPPSPLFGTRAFCLCAKRTLCPLFCFSGVGTPLGAQTTSLCSIAKRLACGKSYPVTAAQLLRLYTGFLAPIHLVKTRKELSEQ